MKNSVMWKYDISDEQTKFDLSNISITRLKY